VALDAVGERAETFRGRKEGRVAWGVDGWRTEGRCARDHSRDTRLSVYGQGRQEKCNVTKARRPRTAHGNMWPAIRQTALLLLQTAEIQESLNHHAIPTPKPTSSSTLLHFPSCSRHHRRIPTRIFNDANPILILILPSQYPRPMDALHSTNRPSRPKAGDDSSLGSRRQAVARHRPPGPSFLPFPSHHPLFFKPMLNPLRWTHAKSSVIPPHRITPHTSTPSNLAPPTDPNERPQNNSSATFTEQVRRRNISSGSFGLLRTRFCLLGRS